MLLPVCSVALGFLSAVAHANTEKTIFVAPERIHLGDVRPNLVDLQLDTLTTAKRELQTALPVAFATNISRGIQSWYLLDNLDPGQRYEVRICWPATVRYSLPGLTHPSCPVSSPTSGADVRKSNLRSSGSKLMRYRMFLRRLPC